MLQDEILELEERLAAPAVRASADALDRLISDEFVEFGSSGRVYTKHEVISQMLAAPGITASFADFRVLAVSPDVALATYRTGRHFAVLSGDVRDNPGESYFTRARPSRLMPKDA